MFQATFHFIPSIWVIFGIIVFEVRKRAGFHHDSLFAGANTVVRPA
jgi:hypothetical protein